MARSRKPDMAPAEIRYRINLEGLTFADLDRLNGLIDGTCRKAARMPLPLGEAAIATALDMNPSSIWPSRYNIAGERLKPQPTENYTNQPTVRASQKGAAA
jgi:Ner family transcriptional regulator